MNGWLIAAALVCAYLIGSIPSAYVAGKIKHIDIRQVGSHNMGAMNVFYKVGLVYGLLVLAIDIGKGALGVAVARWLGVPELVQMLAGIAVILGHAFPVFLKFKGGKGGASCIGVLSFIMPWGMPFYLAVFLLITFITKFPTLAYSAAFICFPLVGWLWYGRWEFIVYSFVILLVPGIRYIPRLGEMRKKGGSWKHVLHRRSLKDRL